MSELKDKDGFDKAPSIAQTARLKLREFHEADWVQVHKYASDPEVVRFIGWGPNTEEDTKKFIQRSLLQQKENPRLNYSLAIVLRDQNELVGGCGLYESNIKNFEGWIGYCLNRQFWGYGYATETARALLDLGFSSLKLHRIFATCDPENPASAHVMEKIGMQYEGRLRENLWCSDGSWRDSLVYAIIDREWKNAK